MICGTGLQSSDEVHVLSVALEQNLLQWPQALGAQEMQWDQVLGKGP